VSDARVQQPASENSTGRVDPVSECHTSKPEPTKTSAATYTSEGGQLDGRGVEVNSKRYCSETGRVPRWWAPWWFVVDLKDDADEVPKYLVRQ